MHSRQNECHQGSREVQLSDEQARTSRMKLTKTESCSVQNLGASIQTTIVASKAIRQLGAPTEHITKNDGIRQARDQIAEPDNEGQKLIKSVDLMSRSQHEKVWSIQLAFLARSFVFWASLSNPHTSVTALRTRVCMLAWTDHLPEILNKRVYILILRRSSSCT